MKTLPNLDFDDYFKTNEKGYNDPLIEILFEIWQIAEINGTHLNYNITDKEGSRKDFEELARKHTEKIISLLELRSVSPTTMTVEKAQNLTEKSGLLDWLFEKI